MYWFRMNHKTIENSIKRPFITAVLGPRRVGKTYFMEHYAETHADRTWVFLNMDQMDQRIRIQNQQLKELISEFAKQRIGFENKIWVVIDEAQKCPELFDQIKLLYDEYKDKDKIKFILTGSAVLSLHQLSSESLAGRIELNYLNEFTLRESSLLHEPMMPIHSLFDILSADPDIAQISELIANIKPFKPVLNQHLLLHLVWGGFPELLAITSDDEKIIYLKNYLQTYLEKDVRAIESITDLNLYRNMMDVLATQTGSVRDDQRIVQALGCSRDTLKKYRGYMEATLLYQNIYPHIDSSLSRLVKSPKGYLIDNGLISILTGIAELSILQKTGLVGHRLENWFLNELNTWIARIALPCSIEYWRTSSGTEVDFIVNKKSIVFPFEITISSQIEKKKIRSLTRFLGEEPKATWGYYIYSGDFLVDEQNKIIFIPAWAIA